LSITRRALAPRPYPFEALNNLGAALTELGEFDEADLVFIAACWRCSRRTPRHITIMAAFWRNATSSTRRSTISANRSRLQPHAVDAHINLGNVAAGAGRSSRRP